MGLYCYLVGGVGYGASGTLASNAFYLTISAGETSASTSLFDVSVIVVERARRVIETVPIEPGGKSRRESVGQLFVVRTVKDFILRVTVLDLRVPAPVVASATKSERYQAGDDVRSPEIIVRDFIWWNPFRLVNPEIAVHAARRKS
jgi:hypothetical protein